MSDSNSTTLYVDKPTLEKIVRISEATRLPRVEVIRLAVEMLEKSSAQIGVNALVSQPEPTAQ